MYRNRGSMPHISISHSSGGLGGHRLTVRPMFIIYYDVKFVLIQMISHICFFMFAILVYILTYKMQFPDPLANMKKTFLLAQATAIGITVILSILASFICKDRDSLILNLKLITIISMIFLLILVASKLYIDRDYTEEKFGEFYEQYERKEEQETEEKRKVSIGLAGIQLIDGKQDYIKNSKVAYTNFTTKCMLYILGHGLLILLLFYLIHRLTKIDKIKDRLEKDDEILYDEENVFK